MRHGDLVGVVVDAQLAAAGFALQLGVQSWLRWRRDHLDRSARWFARWTVLLALAMAANVWVFHAPASQVDVAAFVRTLALTATIVCMLPTAAEFGGRRPPRLVVGTFVVLGATRVALWPTTNAISTHRVDDAGLLVYGDLLAPITLPMMLFLAAALAVLCRGWRDRVEQAAFSTSVVVSMALAAVSLFADDALGTILIGSWLAAPVVGLQVIALRRLARRDADERELTARQVAVTEELGRSERRTRMALRSGAMGWWEYDPRTGAVDAAEELWTLLGETGAPPAHLGPFLCRVHPEERNVVWESLRDAMVRGVAHTEFRWCEPTRRGEAPKPDRWIELTASKVDDGSSRLVGMAKDITARKLAESDLVHRAEHDPLTGFSNRVVLRKVVEASLDRLERFAVLLVDLDRFKDVNDSLGHPVGDRVLCAVAGRFAATLRREDLLARLGGDEFAVVIRADPTVASSVAHQLIESLLEPIVVDGLPVSIRASVGMVLVPEDGSDFDTLLRRADAAMYRAKQRGNTWRRYRMEDELGSARRLELAAQLPGAITRREIEVHFQPTLDLRTGRARSAEALARWCHAEHGMVSPSEFVPLAEQYGMGLALFSVVLERSLCQLARWRREGLLDVCAVNLSPHTLLDPALVPTVARVLEETGVPADALVLEITEDSFIDDTTEVAAAFQGLRRLGVHLAIDDFGAGYSSLAYLHRLDVDHLKLDKSFVDGMLRDTAGDAIVGLTIAVAHQLGLTVVAEGVEDVDTVAALRRHGCDAIQGFWWCRPAPPSEIGAWLLRRRDGRLEALPGGEAA